MKTLVLMAALCSGLVLSGCAGTAAKAIKAGDGLTDAAINYGGEIISDRVVVRSECRRILFGVVRELENDGEWAKAAELLSAAYRPISILQALEDDDVHAITEALNTAHMCAALAAQIQESAVPN